VVDKVRVDESFELFILEFFLLWLFLDLLLKIEFLYLELS